MAPSHIHLRINALQLNNAFRAFVHEPWTRDLTESQSLARIVEMIKNCPRGDRQLRDARSRDGDRHPAVRADRPDQKHVDKETPIRFLIAECECPATVLIAVFFAKLFGVDDITDISPLFETPSGLENGSRIMERLARGRGLSRVRRSAKRLSIQTGFSDAGRFIGQIPATLADRALLSRSRCAARQGGARTMSRRSIFSTHGELMGRGAHPGDLYRASITS